MENNLTEAIEILKRMSEKCVEKALEALREIKEEHEKEQREMIPACPHCGDGKVVRNGKKCGKQAYICRGCSKSFVETTKTGMLNSRYGEATWKQVIRDTVNGLPIDETAGNLDMSHEAVFNMRHKILYALEQEEGRNPTQLQGVCETDETFVLESYKGKELPSDYWREPRKHGAKAKSPGLSDEYICICTGVERGGQAISRAVNRAVVSKDEIEKVFSGRIGDNSVIITDGLKGYSVLAEYGKRAVITANEGNGGFFNMNTVNGFHSFIKERNRDARGFATKYLNRYNTLFSKVFGSTNAVVDDIYNLLSDRDSRNYTINETKTQNLLEI